MVPPLRGFAAKFWVFVSMKFYILEFH